MKLKINRNSILFCAVFFLVILGSKAQDIKENLPSFKELKTFNGVEVVVFPSEENRIEITGHSKEKVKYEVVDGRLEVRLSLDNIWSKDNTLIRVYGNSIAIIDANEGSIINVNGKLRARDLTLRAQEGAQINTRLDTERLYAKAVTGGFIEAEGKAAEQEVDVNTGGRFLGADLRTKSTVVSCGTAGKAEIYASEYCKATAKLGGTIEIFGRPDELDTKTSLGGKIL